jgi:Protein of unknown function (DUF4236)
MPLRFRRSIRLMSGVTLNLSKSGASVSVGPRGAKVTVGSSGVRATAGLPGTGLSYTTGPVRIGEHEHHRSTETETEQASAINWNKIIGIVIFLFVVAYMIVHTLMKA